MKHLKLFVAASVLMLCTGLAAQPQGPLPSPQKHKTPEEIARKDADRMKAEIGLSDKQYKKIYKLFKKDQQYRQSLIEERFGGGMPPMGGPMGGPGSGGPGGFGEGRPEMGRPMGGPGAAGPGAGGPERSMRNSHPEGRPEMCQSKELISDEYLEKQDLKLKKILTENQYRQWRAKHPAEVMELPPMKANPNNFTRKR